MIRAILCLLLLVLALAIINFSSEAAALSDKAARKLDISSSTELAWKSFLERFSFKLYRGASDEKDTLAVYYSEAKRKETLAKQCGYAFLLIASSFLVLRLFLLKRLQAKSYRQLKIDALCVALFAFFIGVFAPILALKAYATVPVLGTVILNYESKSIFAALSALMQSGNWFIAVLISVFSILLPIIKTGISFVCLQSTKPDWANRMTKIIKVIGKWSMADVFVIAIFIAYFAMGSDDFSDATAGVGLYFFVVYCLLSQLVTHFLLVTTSDMQTNEKLS